MTPQSRCLILAATLLLPLGALAASWAVTHRQAQQGQDWLVPIQGYDPRDLLRGHYVQYRYDWPTRFNEDDPAYRDPAYADALCLTGATPHIRNVRPLTAKPDPQATRDCAIIVRAASGARREVRGLDRGIFYASQAQAIALSKKLADPNLQGLIRVRIRPDGVLHPIDLEFRPRPD